MEKFITSQSAENKYLASVQAHIGQLWKKHYGSRGGKNIGAGRSGSAIESCLLDKATAFALSLTVA